MQYRSAGASLLRHAIGPAPELFHLWFLEPSCLAQGHWPSMTTTGAELPLRRSRTLPEPLSDARSEFTLRARGAGLQCFGSYRPMRRKEWIARSASNDTAASFIYEHTRL